MFFKKKFPSEVVPQLMFVEGRLNVISLHQRMPKIFRNANCISKSDQSLKLKGFRKLMNDRRQPLGGGAKDFLRLRIGDRWISILHNGGGDVYLFYAILPRRE